MIGLKQASKRAPSSWRRRLTLTGGALRRGRARFARWPAQGPAGGWFLPAPVPLQSAPPVKGRRCSTLLRVELRMAYRPTVVAAGPEASADLPHLIHLSPPQMIFPAPQKPSQAVRFHAVGDAARSSPPSRNLEVAASIAPGRSPSRQFPAGRRPCPVDPMAFPAVLPAAARSSGPRIRRQPSSAPCSARAASARPVQNPSRRPWVPVALPRKEPLLWLGKTAHAAPDTRTNSMWCSSGSAPAVPAGSFFVGSSITSPPTTTKTAPSPSPSTCARR